jgi:hypothetical protein
LTSKIDNMISKIDRLVGFRTRVALLTNSSGTFHIRELSRSLGIPYSVLYKEVKNLSSLGVLNEEKIGKLTQVSANSKLSFFPEPKSLVIKTTGVGDFLKNELGPIDGTPSYGGIRTHIILLGNGRWLEAGARELTIIP